MAHVENVWLNDGHMAENVMRVNVKLKPAGSAGIEVPIPKQFMEAIMQMAQSAADLHEAKMKAEILGERHDAA